VAFRSYLKDARAKTAEKAKDKRPEEDQHPSTAAMLANDDYEL
jgi:hypothetical protein